MNEVTRLIELNEDKLICLKKYCDCNDMIIKMLDDHNLSALKKLMPKKSALVKSIQLLDDRVVNLVAELKQREQIGSLEEIDVTKFSNLQQLKDLSLSVLKIMLDVKKQDEFVAARIEESFEEYRHLKSRVKTNKLESFTKDYFER